MGKRGALIMAFNTYVISIILISLFFTFLLMYPRITKKERNPNAILAMISMVSWFVSAISTLHYDVEAWPQALLYGGIALVCFFDLIQGIFFMDEEIDDWDLRR